jgi:cobalamin biosynthesis protein CobT
MPETDPDEVRNMMNNVDHMVGPIQKGLERAMAAISATAWTAGHRSGRLHSGSLHRLTLGDDRVFRRKHEAQSKDVAVSLVVDLSGSMIGKKQELAVYAAYALSSVLDRMKINHEVIGFTTRPYEREVYSELRADQLKTGLSYARLEALYMPILKGWEERMNAEVRQRLAYTSDRFNQLRENVDGECVQIAAYRLRQRKENRKVMIVLSDGNPACSGEPVILHDHLKKVVPEIEKSGIEIIGIGIKSPAVSRFYKKYVILDEIEALPGEVLNQLKSLLIRK